MNLDLENDRVSMDSCFKNISLETCVWKYYHFSRKFSTSRKLCVLLKSLTPPEKFQSFVENLRSLLKCHASLILRQKADEANQKLRRYKKYLKGTGGGGGVAIPPGN